MKNEGQFADSRFFFSQLKDAAGLCSRTGRPVFKGFFNESEQAAAEPFLRRLGVSFTFWGGFPDAERRMLGVFPENDDTDTRLFPIDSVTATFRECEKVDHRAVLGTLMAQGIERSCVGDILIEGGRCVFFCRNTVTRALLDGVDRIGGAGVKLAAGHSEPLPAAHGFREIRTTVASARLDCVTAALAGVSRGQAEKLIVLGEVMIDACPCKNVSQSVAGGNKITVRGTGKFIIDDLDTVTRKGRLVLSARKYI